MPFLAAFSAESVTPTTIGIVVICLITLSRWLWDYNRSRREELQQHEPRANPPLHKEYVTREDHKKLEERFEAEVTSQAGKRRGIYTKLEELGKSQARLESESTSQLRHLHSLETKLENMPEKIAKLLKQ